MTVEAVRPQLLETQSPSLLYNVAILEAFQRSARSVLIPEGIKDWNLENEVICVGGSLGKGTGHYWSDLDIVDITNKGRPGTPWVNQFITNMENEFHDLVENNPSFFKVKKYITIAEEVDRRYRERRHQAIKAYQSACKDPTDPMQKNIDFFSLLNKLASRKTAVPDRAMDRLSSVFFARLPEPKYIETFTHPLHDFYSSTDHKVRTIIFGDSEEEYADLCTIFSSTPGLTSYEVVPGNLLHHQKKLVTAIRQLHDNNYDGYRSLHDRLGQEWQTYRRRTSLKHAVFFRRISADREGNVFQLNDFFHFRDFPGITELETFFAKQT